MIFGVMKKYNIQLFFLIVSCLCSGCVVVRFTTDERVVDKKINKEIFDSFYVEELEVNPSYFYNIQLRKDLNEFLEKNYPDNFNITNAIPLHIGVEWEPIRPLPIGIHRLWCAIFYRQNESSYVDIFIKTPKAIKLPTARVDYRYSKSYSITPLALFIPGKSSFGSSDTFRDVFIELISIGIVDAINRLEAHELQGLRDHYFVSDAQRKHYQSLIGDSIKTIERKINDNGEVEFVEYEHKYQIKENLVQSHFPKIIKQNFDAARNLGFIEANVTNCSDIESDKYLKEFLIPTICVTKNIVFTLNKMELPSGAKFRIIKDIIRDEKGQRVREIEFEAIE